MHFLAPSCLPAFAPSELAAPTTADAQERREQRHHAIARRRARTVALGPHMRLQFEDRLTLRHQIREVLRAERIADPHEAQREAQAYAHLLPDGSNWKATLLIELPDAQQRARDLPLLSRAAHALYAEIDVAPMPRDAARAADDDTAGTGTGTGASTSTSTDTSTSMGTSERVYAHANEDLADRHLGRPSGVHFLRFQFTAAQCAALRHGAAVRLGCAHESYRVHCALDDATAFMLRRDLAPRHVPHETLAAPSAAGPQEASARCADPI